MPWAPGAASMLPMSSALLAPTTMTATLPLPTGTSLPALPAPAAGFPALAMISWSPR